MPIYEYRCNECGEAFEKIVRFTEADQIPACPRCESVNTHKRISTIASFGTSPSGTLNSSSSSCGSRGSFT
ncbi:MAG: hypothetical protein FD147_1670 [Chloroflexi bacterium]|nr:MAG: hypothetical protein FD147_1670 [Chloroflexota bacterium]